MRLLNRTVGFPAPAVAFLALSVSAVEASRTLPAGRNVLLADYLMAPRPEDVSLQRELAEDMDLLVLHDWNASKIPTFRAANPDIMILMYKNRGFMMGTKHTGEAVALYNDVDHNDSWFMHTSAGSHLIWDWDKNGVSDYASPRPENTSFQTFFFDRVMNQLTSQNWDGVFIDDLWTRRDPYSNPHPVEYSSNIALHTAMNSYLASGRTRLTAAGKLVGGNIGWWQEPTSGGGRVGRAYLDRMDVAMQEKFFVNYSTRWNTGSAWWTEVQALREDLRVTGDIIIAHARGNSTDVNAMRYALGTYLCITNRDGKFAFSYKDDKVFMRMPLMFNDYNLAEGLGAAVGGPQWHSSYQVGYRQFANGYVVVNPTGSTKVVRDLDPLTDINGIGVPSTGAVLLPYTAGMYFINYGKALNLAGLN